MAARFPAVTNMTSKEVTKKLLSRRIKPKDYRGSDNTALLDMLQKMKDYYKTIKEDMSTIKQEIKVIINENEQGRHLELDEHEWETTDGDDVSSGVTLGSDSSRSLDSGDLPMQPEVVDLDDSDSEVEPELIDLAESSDEDTYAEMGARYRTLKDVPKNKKSALKMRMCIKD